MDRMNDRLTYEGGSNYTLSCFQLKPTEVGPEVFANQKQFFVFFTKKAVHDTNCKEPGTIPHCGFTCYLFNFQIRNEYFTS